jgi:hypothetical protein
MLSKVARNVMTRGPELAQTSRFRRQMGANGGLNGPNLIRRVHFVSEID